MKTLTRKPGGCWSRSNVCYLDSLLSFAASYLAIAPQWLVQSRNCIRHLLLLAYAVADTHAACEISKDSDKPPLPHFRTRLQFHHLTQLSRPRKHISNCDDCLVWAGNEDGSAISGLKALRTHTRPACARLSSLVSKLLGRQI